MKIVFSPRREHMFYYTQSPAYVKIVFSPRREHMIDHKWSSRLGETPIFDEAVLEKRGLHNDPHSIYIYI